MISSQINKQQMQTSNDRNILSNLTSSTSVNSLTTKTNPTLIPTLPALLAAPVGWSSQIIDSNSPIPIDNEINLIDKNNHIVNKYEEYNTINTSQINQIPSRFQNNNTEYLSKSINTNSFHRQQPTLSEQQQKNIINIIENQQPPPLIVRKKLPNDLVTYEQHVSVKYLQPPTPPPPGPIIIREVHPPPLPPEPPIQIRQRPAPSITPPPLVLREQPPPITFDTSAKIVEKLLPPIKPERGVIVERYGACPPKPSDVVIERWLPYKQFVGQRRVLLERAPAPHIPQQDPNLLVLYDSPHARIHKQFINKGVVRADPDSYLQQYGPELYSWHSNSQNTQLVAEATRAIPPPSVSSSDHHYRTSYLDQYQRASSPYISTTWERTRVASPIPRSSSYHDSYSYYDSPNHYCNQSSYKYGYEPPYHYCNQSSSRDRYDSPYHYCNESSSKYRYEPPYHYCNQSSSRYGYDSYRSYDDYPILHESYRTTTDIAPSWDRYYRSSSFDPYYRSSSYYPSNTIHVSSEKEFCHVLCDLTNGRVPSRLGSY